MSTLEREAPTLRPVARWVQERGETGRDRLVMVWSVPDPHIAMLGLGTAQA